MAPSKKRNGGSYSRGTAKKIASSKMFTATGEPIHNLEAYTAAGGKPRSASGELIHNPRAYRNTIEASVRQNTNDPKYLYHYTNKAAAESIETSGAIKASASGLDGAGTYCTAKPPRCSSDTLISNNYGQSGARGSSYVDNYARIDTDNLGAKRVNSSRDIWKVDGDINLEDHNAFLAQRDGNSGGRKNTAKKWNDNPYNSAAHEEWNDNPYNNPYNDAAAAYEEWDDTPCEEWQGDYEN